MGLQTPCLARSWQTLAGAGVAGATAALGGEPAAGGHWEFQHRWEVESHAMVFCQRFPCYESFLAHSNCQCIEIGCPKLVQRNFPRKGTVESQFTCDQVLYTSLLMHSGRSTV